MEYKYRYRRYRNGIISARVEAMNIDDLIVGLFLRNTRF